MITKVSALINQLITGGRIETPGVVEGKDTKLSPELNSFIEKARTLSTHKWVRREVSIQKIVSTLVGGDRPSLSLRNGLPLLEYAARAVFPYEKQNVFDLELVNANLKNVGQSISGDAVRSSHDYVLLVRFSQPLVEGDKLSKRLFSGLELYFFIPSQLSDFLRQQNESTQDPSSSQGDTVYKVSYRINHGRDSLEVNSYTNFEQVKDDKLLKKRSGNEDFFVRADKQLVEALEKTTSLPLVSS